MALQTTTSDTRNWTIFLVLSCVIGIGIRLQVISQDFEAILSRFGSDDLFYFTELAKNLKTGLGLTFDGKHLTNGVQPLWLLLLLPIAPLFEDPLCALRSVLLLATLVTVITALSFPKLLTLISPNNGFQIGVIAGSIYILHPKILQITFEGTEASIAAFAWLISIYAWVQSQQSNKYFLLGIALGFGVLARIDHLILVVFLFIFPFKDFKNYTLKAIQILPGFLLILTPWLITSYLATGNIFPDSGGVKRLHFLRYLALENDISLADVSQRSLPLTQFFSAITNGFRFGRILVFAESTYSISLILAVCLTLVIALTKPKKTFETTKEALRKISPVIAASFSIIIVYLLYIQFLRSWYFIPLFVLVVIFLSVFLQDTVSQLKITPQRKQLIIFIGLWTALGFMQIEAKHNPRKGVGSNYFESLHFAKKNLPNGVNIGAFNAGLAGAVLSPNYQVINLDGVVNNSVKNALSEFKLSQYIRQNSIEYILDYNKSIEFYYAIGSNSGMNTLTLVSEFESTNKNELTVGLWKVRLGD